jgi:uncharacterized protein (TIGR02996 family)
MQSDREALVAAIRARPDDDGPRLVCADWFEDQGDDASVARAQFIRTQVARARLSPQDPRQRELEARELRLLNQYSRAWSGSHPVFKKSRFRRGFVEYVHLNLQHFQHHRRRMFALEPVRDVSVTGWMRAPDDLVRRVAACEEWRHVDTLRIHHQGPHKSPRSNLVALLESPHLTGLRSLRLPMLAIDADARRRLERLPVLARLSELTLPDLDTYPDDSGPWFSDGLPPGQLARLRSLRVGDYYPTTELFRQLSAAPFWDQLQSLEVKLPDHDTNEGVALLRDRLPPGLESFRLVARGTPGESGDLDALYTELAARPLRRLEVHWVPISPAALASLLGRARRCELRELRLLECGLSDEHMAVLAGSAGACHLENLHLSQYQGVTPEAAGTLLSSRDFGSVVSLRLGIPSFWPHGVSRLAGNPAWAALRHLELAGDGLTPSVLSQFLDSENARRLVRLGIEADYQADFSVTTDFVDQIGRLPHLARLTVLVDEVDGPVRTQLNRLRPRVWSTVRCYNSEADYEVDPNDVPPLDEDLAGELDQWA